MNIVKMFLSSLSIVIGVCAVFVGMLMSRESSGSMSIVIGGGLFMALGIVFLIQERD